MNPFLVHRRVEHRRRSWGQRMVLGFNFVLITACLLAAAALGYGAQRAASINRVELDRSLTALPAGARGDRVINILLVGSDSSANLDPDDPIQIGRQGERLGDVIIVAHLDERDGTVSLLSLPRDLWVPIAGTDRHDRINRAFVVGGAATLIDTIEEKFGIPIHHYVNVDFAGFQGLVEAVGSVEVHFETPARDWNVNASPPRSQTGFLMAGTGCQSLDPVQALAYVRSRYYQVQDADGAWVTDRSSDLGRIRRQQDFLRRLMEKAIQLGARNPLVLRDLIGTGIGNVAIDGQLTPGLLLDLGATYRDFEPEDLQNHTFPVEDATVGSSRVLRPRTDDAAPLLALFSGASADDPDTVAVEVVYDAGLAGTGSDTSDGGRWPQPVAMVVDSLDEAGFDLGLSGGSLARIDTGTVPPGLTLRYGQGSRGAAEVVARYLAGQGRQLPDGYRPVLVEVEGQDGRQVVVTLGPAPIGAGRPADHSPTTGPAPGSEITGPSLPDDGTAGHPDPAGEDDQSRLPAGTCM